MPRGPSGDDRHGLPANYRSPDIAARYAGAPGRTIASSVLRDRAHDASRTVRASRVRGPATRRARVRAVGGERIVGHRERISAIRSRRCCVSRFWMAAVRRTRCASRCSMWGRSRIRARPVRVATRSRRRGCRNSSGRSPPCAAGAGPRCIRHAAGTDCGWWGRTEERSGRAWQAAFRRAAQVRGRPVGSAGRWSWRSGQGCAPATAGQTMVPLGPRTRPPRALATSPR